MIEGLQDVLESSGQTGLVEIRALLEEVFGESTVGMVIAEQRLKRSVYRLQIEAGGQLHSLVIKRLASDVALRNQLVLERWLPAIGLGEIAPRLLGIAAERSGKCVWHVYEDLGDWGLDPRGAERGRVEKAVEVIARLHTRSAGHAVILEGRRYGGDLGIHFYTSNVCDAIDGLEALLLSSVELSSQHLALRDRLLERLHRLLDEQGYRARVMEELGGPDVLLHGDLWTINAFVLPTADGPQARLIDWDHAGIGPSSYDLSTFLYRFPVRDRPWIVACYRQAVERAGWRLPSGRDLNLLFDTAECARYASRIIWPCISLLLDRAEWGFAELAEIEQWFEKLEPALPVEDETEPEVYVDEIPDR